MVKLNKIYTRTGDDGTTGLVDGSRLSKADVRKAAAMLADPKITKAEVARHFADIEAIHTYEGTETVQGLIIGREITGVGAFV